MHHWYASASAYKDRQWLFRRDKGGKWIGTSYGEAIEKITSLACGLASLGLKDDERVIILGENSPEWVMSNFSVLAAGGISVPSYTTYTAADYQHLLTDSDARMAIIEHADLADKLLSGGEGGEGLEKIILMNEPAEWQEFKQKYPHLECNLWQDLIQQGKTKQWHDLAGVKKAADKTAVLIYTSGTVSKPLGVELSHRALLANMRGCHHVVEQLPFIGHEVFLSFLPLSHAYEYMCGQFLTSSMGAEVYFTSVEFLRRDLQEVRPTIVTAVPRLYEAFYGSIRQLLNTASPFKKWLFRKTYELGKLQYIEAEKFHLWNRCQNFLLGILVRKKVKKLLGGRLKAFVSGGAALNAEVALFFTSLDILILQGYGLTEFSPVVSVNIPRNRNKPDDIYGVGYPLQGVEIKIADDGEILIKGDSLMNGYWRNAEKTASAIKDGWLHSGDIGFCDAAGRLHITDRKKDIIVTAGGDNISPQKIENLLSLQDTIAQAVIYTDERHKNLHALIVAEKRAQKSDIEKTITQVNQQLSSIEKIQNWQLAEEEFSIENGLMTPSMKLKRRKILQKYGLQ